VLHEPKEINVCKNVLQPKAIDLTTIYQGIFNNSSINNYNLEFFKDNNLTQLIAKSNEYFPSMRENHSVYLVVEDIKTSCKEVFVVNIKFNHGEIPSKIEDIKVCNEYILPEIQSNQIYYTELEGKKTFYKGGDVLELGKYKMFLLQDNGNDCYEEVVFNISIEYKSDHQNIDDQFLSCELYTIPESLPNNKFYIEKNNQKIEIATGTEITENNVRVYIISTSNNGACVQETSFLVQYDDCPFPKGFSPNGDGYNDTFDLSIYGVTNIKVFNRLGMEVYSFSGNYTNQWNGKDKNSKNLPTGTYYYVIQSFNKTKTGWVEIMK